MSDLLKMILVPYFILKNRYGVVTLKQKSPGSYFLSVVDVWWKSWEPQKLNVGSCEISFYSLTIGCKYMSQSNWHCSYLIWHCWKSVIKMNHLCPDIIHVVYNLHAYKKVNSKYTKNEIKGKDNISTAVDCLSLTLVCKKLLINVVGVTWALRGVFMKSFL